MADYQAYHDAEWGRPVGDDRRLFEKLCLEGFQAGLSWLTILRKRETFRAAFAGFDFEAVARFGERDVARLLQDAGIIRHRGKIEACINNAQRAVELVEERGSLATYFWSFEPAPEGCRIDFFLAFEFKSRLLQRVIGSLFNDAVRKMVGAFELRARALYGPGRAHPGAALPRERPA